VINIGKIDKVYKDVSVEIQYKDIVSGTQTDTMKDHFAIRPKKFVLNLPTTAVKAGNKFDLKIKAVDQSNKVVKGYAEKINDSLNITYKDKNTTCTTGTLTLTQSKFVDGIYIDKNSKYDEIGEVDINVSEILGHEFAKIDSNDTPASQRLISPAGITVTFIPDNFSASIKLNDAKPGITLYSSDLSNMGASLDISLKAISKNGSVVSNYTDGCYSKDTDIKIYYQHSNSVDSQNLITDQNITSKSSSFFGIKIDKSKFSSGKVTQKMKINLDRNNTISKNPNQFTINKVQVSDGVTSSIANIISNNKAHFYYARAHVASPQSSDSGVINANVYYEVYCKGCNKNIFTQAKGKASIDGVYWYILPSSTITAFGSSIFDYNNLRALDPSKILKVKHINRDNILIKPKNPNEPSKNRIYYTPIHSFLQYHKFGANLPEHYFDVIFSTSGKWAGEGEQGKTVNTNIFKKQNSAIEW